MAEKEPSVGTHNGAARRSTHAAMKEVIEFKEVNA